MTEPPILELRGVSKFYPAPTERTNWRALVPGSFGDPGRRSGVRALNEVDLAVARGSTVGVIGANGSGKSTLLKVVAGVLDASQGALERRGRVAAMIELGSGFDPELSGRDNLWFGGLLLGMDDDQMAERFDDIVAFSGIGDFLDVPVKRYSSGMMVRLGFSLAASVSADLLLIDEVFAVGDHGFQRRSFQRIREMRDAGTSMLIVSHAHEMLATLCDTMILMERGRITLEGPPEQVIEHYIGLQGRPEAAVVLPSATGSAAHIRSVELSEDAVEPGGALHVDVDLEVAVPSDARLYFTVYTQGRAIGPSMEGPSEALGQPGRWRVRAVLDELPLRSGAFELNVAVADEPVDGSHRLTGVVTEASAAFEVGGESEPRTLLEVAWSEPRPVAAGPGATAHGVGSLAPRRRR